MRYLYYYILALFLFSATFAIAADEALFPHSVDYKSKYSITETTIHVGDTIVVTKDFINSGSEIVSNLYFSEHLPQIDSIELVEHSISINGNAVSYLFYKESNDPIIEEVESYYWILDSPNPLDNINNEIAPGDSIHMELKFMPRKRGNYTIPMQVTVFSVGSLSYFAFSENINISIEYLCGDVNGDDLTNILDVTFLINFLYFDGPEPQPYEAGDINSNGVINILDVTHIIAYIYRDGSAPVCP